jgi:DNA-binding NtrC family response regulator
MKRQKDTVDFTYSFNFEAPILPWKEQCEKFMCAYFEHVLTQMNGNVSASSRLLKMNRTHFYKLVKQHGIGRFRPEGWLKKSDIETQDHEKMDMVATEGCG